MDVKTFFRTLAILISLTTLAATGCTSSSWWKQTPNGVASNQYPSPPASNFGPRSVSTPGVGQPSSQPDQDYRPDYISRNPNSNGGAGMGRDYPTTGNGGAEYPTTGVGNQDYNNDSFNRNASFNNSPVQGHYDVSGGGNTSGENYAPKGGFDDGGFRNADRRNGFSNDGIGNPPPSGHEPWESNSNSFQGGGGSNNSNSFETAPFNGGGDSSSSATPWSGAAQESDFERKSRNDFDSFKTPDRSFDSPAMGSNNRESSPELPPNLNNSKGNFKPGSIGQQFGASRADERSGGFDSSKFSGRQVNYEEEVSNDFDPANMPDAGDAFRSGALLDNFNDRW